VVAPRLRLVTGLTCTEIVTGPDDEEVDHLVCRTLERRKVEVSGRRLGAWERHDLGGRQIWFMPVGTLDPSDQPRR